MVNEQLISKGRRAQQLLDDEVFKDTIAEMLADTMMALVSTKPSFTKEREEFYFFYKAVENIQARLRADAESGRMEERMAEQSELKKPYNPELVDE